MALTAKFIVDGAKDFRIGFGKRAGEEGFSHRGLYLVREWVKQNAGEPNSARRLLCVAV